MAAEYVRRLLQAPRQSFFLFGPRGSGKSTWVREELPRAHRIDLLDAFDLETALGFGSLPIIWQAPSRTDALVAYAQMYLREEIQAEALVRNLPGFARFLPIAALFHAQTLNTASLARDAGVARTTVNGYLEIIEDTLLAFRLPAYEGRLRVREKRHPKLYWVDAGIVRALRRHLGTPSVEERGALLEGWVANLLRIHNDYAELFDEWYYWAPAEAVRTEVDLLLTRGRESLAIEVKSAAKVGPEALRGLRAIAGLPRLARRVLVHLGPRPLVTADKIEVWPVGRLLRALAERTLWP